MTISEEFEHLKEKLLCAFCLVPLENREAHEVLTSKRAILDVPAVNGEAVAFTCSDCKDKEPKFVVNGKGQHIDTERLPAIKKIGVSENVKIAEEIGNQKVKADIEDPELEIAEERINKERKEWAEK